MGEQHKIRLRVPGPEAEAIASRLTDGLAEAEFPLPGHIVADVALVGAPQRADDGSMVLEIEALTIAE